MAKRKGDLVSLIVIFVAVIVFIPIAIKYLNSVFGKVVSGFQNMIVPKVNAQRQFGSAYLPCRSPDPETGAVCDEGQFCSEGTCISNTVPTTGEQVGYLA